MVRQIVVDARTGRHRRPLHRLAPLERRDRLAIDVPRAVEDKMVLNARKYPADEVRGSASKRTGGDGDRNRA